MTETGSFDLPEAVCVMEDSEGLQLYCAMCALVFANFGTNAQIDLVEDEAYFHVLHHDRNHYAE